MGTTNASPLSHLATRGCSVEGLIRIKTFSGPWEGARPQKALLFLKILETDVITPNDHDYRPHLIPGENLQPLLHYPAIPKTPSQE